MSVTFMYVLLDHSSQARVCVIYRLYLEFLNSRGIGFFRTAYYIPSILGSSIAIAVLWRALFAIDGVLNGMFRGDWFRPD